MQAFLLPQHKYRIILLHVTGEDNSESAEITRKNAFLSLIIMMKMKGNHSLIISECVQNVEKNRDVPMLSEYHFEYILILWRYGFSSAFTVNIFHISEGKGDKYFNILL